MKFHVVEPPKIILKESGYRPIETPIVSHVSRSHWTNYAEEIYTERFSKEAFLNTPDLPMPMPDSSFIKRFGMNSFIRFVRVMLGLGAYMNAQRGTHPFGVAGKGKLKILQSADIPEHDFFVKGKEFKIRARHSNAAFNDDACAQVRGLAIKFADTQFESPLDLFFGSGTSHPFWSLDSLWKFMKTRLKADFDKDFWEPQRPWLEDSPAAYIGACDSMRIAPSSFANMVYHSLSVYPFTGKDGIQRYAKYRVMPKGLQKESGLLNRERQETAWEQSREKDNDSAVDYLTTEFRNRIKKSPIEYTLQIQLRDFNSNKDTHEFFNMARYWNDIEHPWVDLAEFEINEAMSEEETAPMRMYIGNSPKSIGILRAGSKEDYNSVNWGRALIYNHSYRQRKRKAKY